MRKFIIFIILIIFLMGCTWNPKTILPEYFRVLHIPKFNNETLEPQLVEFFTKRVREKFESDGRLTVTDYVSKANGILFVDITKYKRVPVSYNDRGELDVNALTIRIDLQLKDIKTRKMLHDTYIEETIEYNFKSEPVETEIQAQTRIIEIISDKVVSKIIEGW